MNQEICIICMNDIASIHFIPCKHCIVCAKCFHLLESEKCPVCRTNLKEVVYKDTSWSGLHSYIGHSEFWSDKKLQYIDRGMEQVNFPYKLIEEQRKLIKALVKSFTFHVVILGYQENDIRSLFLSLQLLYPVVSESSILQRVVDELCCTQTFLGFLSQFQPIFTLLRQGELKKVLEWLCPDLSALMPNMEMNSFPIHVDSISLSKLELLSPCDSFLLSDVLVLCIDSRSRESLWKTLIFDEYIRKLKWRQNRIWLFQHYDAVECQYNTNAIQRNEIEQIVGEMRTCERPADILYMNGEGIFKLWLRELAFQILTAAKGVRCLCRPCKEDDNRCRCM